jgi:hypothetical protein
MTSVTTKGHTIVYQHECGYLGRVTWHPQKFAGYWRRFQEARDRGELGLTRTHDPEERGKTIQGFRIDLDAVKTVADIELYWNDQKRHAPETIPVEVGRR